MITTFGLKVMIPTNVKLKQIDIASLLVVDLANNDFFVFGRSRNSNISYYACCMYAENRFQESGLSSARLLQGTENCGEDLSPC